MWGLCLEVVASSIFLNGLNRIGEAILVLNGAEVFGSEEVPCDSSTACFKISTTWLIAGRSLGFLFKHLSANFAIFLAAFMEYCFWRRGSMIMLNLLLSAGNCFTQSRSFCSDNGRFLSMVRLPVIISYSTTPKLHMSLFTVKRPVATYSGAAYPRVPTGCYKKLKRKSNIMCYVMWYSPYIFWQSSSEGAARVWETKHFQTIIRLNKTIWI